MNGLADRFRLSLGPAIAAAGARRRLISSSIRRRFNPGRGADRDDRSPRAGDDPDRPPRAYAHPCRAGRLSRRPNRSRRDRVAAALREADEEIGLDPRRRRRASASSTPIGPITGFDVIPVLGVVPPDLRLAPHEHEVADWFEAPLDFVLDPANQQRRSGAVPGARPPLLRDQLERAENLGGDRGDDRQPVAAGSNGPDHRRRQMAPAPRGRAGCSTRSAATKG